jgi:uncharacterized membrane protein YkoI
VGFVVDKVSLGQVCSEYFGFPCQSSFHQLLHNHYHLSSGADAIGQTAADIPSGLSLTPQRETKKKAVNTKRIHKNKVVYTKLLAKAFYKVYIGQTGKNVTTRYKEHINNVRHNKEESAFAQYISNQGNQYRPMEQIMEMAEHAKKGNILNIKANYYIYHFNHLTTLMEEQRCIKENVNHNNMFDTIIRHQYTHTSVTGH